MITHTKQGRGRATTLAGTAAIALCAMTFLATPAQATTVYAEPEVFADLEVGPSGSSSCHVISQQVAGPNAPLALGDNDTESVTISGTTIMEPALDAGASITAASKLKITATTSTLGGNPRTILVSGASRTSTVAAAENTCESRSIANSFFSVGFSLSKAHWVTVKNSNTGSFSTLVSLGTGGEDSSIGAVSGALNVGSSGTMKAYLPAGDYGTSIQLGATIPFTTKSRETTGSGSASLSFAAAGSATVKPAGSALSYTSLGSARSCSTHTLSAGVTSSTTKFTKLSRVSWSVNGKTVKSVKGSSLKRGLSVKLPISDTKSASVKTTVTFTTGKTATAKASYLACR